MARASETALITGASSGIGRALALEFARHDFDVVLVARSADKLKELAKEIRDTCEVEAVVFPMDLSEPAAPKALFEKVTRKDLQIDALVNNAGVAITEPFAETDFDRLMGLVNLNVVTLAALTRLFMKPMIDRGHGRILNVASIVSFFPTPSFAAYGASKAFALSLTEALSQEVRGTGVTVTALCPGYTETNMIHGAFEEAGRKGVEDLIPSFWKLTPEACAREGFKACMRGKPIAMDRLSNEVMAQWVKYQPRWVVRNIGGLMARFIRS